ncbi:zinc finger protein Xfin-like [Clupea harengus]|uniref:Zinc finger protein Xfin-like n=1 Tax=Clupea harengus TaxID=7950 RepID=A0A6P8EUK9_CLUHA|nr:zinc finger protein Xfin-like [Clupea harengus]
MLTAELLEEQVASVMATLTKTAVTEICKVIDSGFAEVRREVCLRQSELESLRTKVRSLTSERRGTTASVEWSSVNKTPPRRSVAVQVSYEQGVAECSTLMDTQAQGEAVVELIVKVEGREEHGTQATNQSPGEDPAFGCSVSRGSFPQWGDGSSHKGTTSCSYREYPFNGPTFSPSQSDTSTEPRPGPHRADQLHAHAAPLHRHSSALLPAALGLVKKEEEGEGVDTPEVERADTAGQTHVHTHLQSHLSGAELDAHTHTPALVQKHEVQQRLERGQVGGQEGEEERGLFRGPTHGEGFLRYQQLQAHGEERAGERGTKCGTTPANAAIHRKCPAKEYLNCSGEKHWHSEMEAFSEQKDLNTHLTHSSSPLTHTHLAYSWGSVSSHTHTHLTHTQDSTSALTHTQEPEGFGDLQLELKAEQEEEDKVDQNLHTIPSCPPPKPALSSPDSQLPLSSSTFSEPSSSSSTLTLAPNLLFVTTTEAMTTAETPTASPIHLFHCSSCPKSFPQETALKRHERSHSDDRQFGCDVCGKSFKMRCTLQQHKLLHSGSKPFACHYCGKRFAQASNMKTHQRIHTGERPYLCPLCGQTFNQHSHLTTHQNRMHQILHNRNTAHELLQRDSPPSLSLATEQASLSSLSSPRDKCSFLCV